MASHIFRSLDVEGHEKERRMPCASRRRDTWTEILSHKPSQSVYMRAMSVSRVCYIMMMLRRR
jgi:hypothetical protein